MCCCVSFSDETNRTNHTKHLGTHTNQRSRKRMIRATELFLRSEKNLEETRIKRELQAAANADAKQKVVEEALEKVFTRENLMFPYDFNLSELEWKKSWPKSCVCNVETVLAIVQPILQEKYDDDTTEILASIKESRTRCNCDHLCPPLVHEGSLWLDAVKRKG